MVASLNVPWPREFLNMISVFSAVSTISRHMSALSCEMVRGQNPVGIEASMLYNQTVLLIFTPPVVACVLFVYWVVLAPYCSFTMLSS